MSFTPRQEKQIDWIFRILITANVALLIAGYIGYLQTKDQLISPLIPRQTVNEIMDDTGLIPASIVSGVFMLSAVWCYTFGKKAAAIIVLILSLIVFEILKYQILISRF
jgi:hypothetical protein